MEIKASTRENSRLADIEMNVFYRMSLPDGKYEYMSPASFELFEVTPEEFYKSPKKIRDLMLPKWLPYFEEQWHRLLAGEMPPTYEYQIVTPSGKTKWIGQRNVLIVDDNGTPIAIEGITFDVTDTHELIREKQTAQRYLDIAGTMIISLDKQGNITLINQKACRVVGWSEQEAKGKNWIETFLPEDKKQEVREVFEKIMAGNLQEVEFFENSILTRDGDERIIAWHNSVLLDEDGQTILELLSSGEDITDRKKIDAALTQSEAIFSNFFNHGNIGAAIATPEKRFIKVNQKYQDLLGYSETELLKITWDEMTCPEDFDSNINLYNQLLSGEINHYELDKRYYRKDGKVLFALLSVSCVRNADGSPDYILATIQDIAELKEAEHKAHEARERLQRTFDISPGLIAIANINSGFFIECNQAVTAILGYSTEEFTSRPINEFIHPDDRQRTENEIIRQLQGNLTTNFQNRYLCKDGSYKWLSWQGTAADETGKVYAMATDITELKKSENALRNSEQKFRALFEQAGGYCMILDPNTSDGIPLIVDVNDAACLAHGYTRDELIGRPVADIDDEDGKKLVLKRTAEIMTGKPFYVENQHVRKDGSTFSVAVNANRIDIGKEAPLIFTTEYDVTKRKLAEAQLRTLYQAIEHSPVSIVVTNPQGCIEYVNGTFEKITGYSFNEVNGQNTRILRSGKTPKSIYRELWDSLISGKSWQGNLQNKKKNGELFWEHVQIAPVLNTSGNVDHYVAVKEDITQQKVQEEKIIHQAHFDSLTDLPNRFLALDRLNQLINEAKRDHSQAAVLFIDLDDFKKINDSLGHETGDDLLIEAATRLLSVSRGDDTVSRLGGDEFLFLVRDIKNIVQAQMIATKLLDSFREPFTINNRDLIITASIGIAVYPDDGISASELLRNADSAMYHSKELGRNTYSFFTNAMNIRVSRKLALEEQMHGALNRNEFSVAYQAQIEVNSGKIIGAEALLRWENPVLGHLSPVEFIPVAEQTGLILRLGMYVIEQALNRTKDWQKYSAEFRIAINISPRQFRDPELIKNIRQLLKQTQVDAQYLELEITEGVLLSGQNYITKALGELSDMGINIAMDDFGTGYSSLSYLRNYPFNILKIDQTFINDISIDPADRKLITAAIAMSHGLNLKVVAEGVETLEQLNYLKKLNCDYAQGYLFSRPITAEKFTELLKKQTKTQDEIHL